MKVLLAAFGSTGDVYPLIAYGRALVERGHQVLFATPPLYEAEVKKAGLDFLSVPPYWSQEEFAAFMTRQSRTPIPMLQLRNLYKASLEFIGELFDKLDGALRNCDVLVTSYMFPSFGSIAKRLGKPFGVFYFCHNFIPTKNFPMEGFPPAPRGLPKKLRESYNRRTWIITNELIDNTINSILAPFIEERKLEPFRGWMTDPAPLGIVAVSEILKDRRGIEDPRYKFTGYLRWQAPEDEKMEKELQEFCAGQLVPVLNFGSTTPANPDKIMKRFLKHWPEGKKFILQSGWSNFQLSENRPEIKLLGKMSHDQLFRFASMVIHVGAAGITASAMYAGKPHIAVPHFADQPFFASEIERLGLGVKIPKTRWPEKLPGAVQEIEESPKYRLAAEGLMPKVRAENGPQKSVEVLEELVRDWKGWPTTTELE
jgi:vancomycin aglycone glucosyltransferase